MGLSGVLDVSSTGWEKQEKVEQEYRSSRGWGKSDSYQFNVR